MLCDASPKGMRWNWAKSRTIGAAFVLAALRVVLAAADESVLRDLALILPKPARTDLGYAWQYPEQKVQVRGTESEAPARIVEAFLDLEASQRGFFVELPDYRLRFAWESLRESFGAASYGEFKRQVLEKTSKPGLIFNLNWEVEPKGAGGREAFLRVRKSGSSWSESLLQWDQLPESWEAFRDSLRAQLDVQYRSVTRKRVLEEAVSQKTPECLQSAMAPRPGRMRYEYQKSLKDFERQQTRMGFVVVRGSESELRRFLDESAVLQKAALAALRPGGRDPMRSEIEASRARIVAELRQKFSSLQWTQASVLWPALGPAYPAQTGGLSQDQLGFALKAPLGQVLLPNTLESSEIWMVTGESREAVVTLPFTDAQVQVVLANRLKTTDYTRCVLRWFESELGTHVLPASGLLISPDGWQQALARALGGGGAS